MSTQKMTDESIIYALPGASPRKVVWVARLNQVCEWFFSSRLGNVVGLLLVIPMLIVWLVGSIIMGRDINPVDGLRETR